MTRVWTRPWLASGILHGLALIGLAVLVTPFFAPQSMAVEMHLVSQGPSADKVGPSVGHRPWKAPQAKSDAPRAPRSPAWDFSAPQAVVPSRLPPVPTALDSLLPSSADPPESRAPSQRETTAGWSTPGGTGYTPPELPPLAVIPPQGAQWELSIDVPGSGGLAIAIRGLDSGHPELDHWLEGYLQTVSFPSNLDATPYSLHWSLSLTTERPQ